jgi:hypothetical protein
MSTVEASAHVFLCSSEGATNTEASAKSWNARQAYFNELQRTIRIDFGFENFNFKSGTLLNFSVIFGEAGVGR